MIRRVVTECAESVSLHDIALPLMDEAKLFSVTQAYPMRPHCHPIFEMHYVHTGALTWEIEGRKRLDIQGGSVTVIQPNTRHRSMNDAETPSIFLSLCVLPDPPSPSPPFVTREEQDAAFRILRESGSRAVHGSQELDAAFSALRKTAHQLAHSASRGASAARRPGDYKVALSVLDAALLRNMLHQCFLRMLSTLANPGPVPHYAPVRRARRYIEQHIADRLSIPDLCRATGLSRSRFNALFHAETGENPAEYILRHRLNFGMRLLRKSRLPITDIALESGFPSSQHFANTFRKYFGLTPTAWRNQAVGS